MFGSPAYKIPTPIVQAIEDAVLLGHVRELVGVLELIKDEEDFPKNMRYGLESLLYLRMYYGKDGDLAPTNDADRQKIAHMEMSWGRELIQNIGHSPDMTELKYA